MLLLNNLLQAGPVECLRRPKDPSGRPKSFAFICFKHDCSVPYAKELFKGTRLFNRVINVDARDNNLKHIPVLDTHFTEFTGRHSRDGGNKNKPSTWADLKNDSLNVSNLLNNSLQQDSKNHFTAGESPMIHNFNSLLQFGQQLMLPGLVQLPEMPGIPMMGLGPNLGNQMFPSMLGNMNGGSLYAPSNQSSSRGSYKDREWTNYIEGGRIIHGDRQKVNCHRDRERLSRDFQHDTRNQSNQVEGINDHRYHPYSDRQHKNWADRKQHDRSSSSHSSHRQDRYDRKNR